MVLTLQPIRAFPQHSGETETRLTTVRRFTVVSSPDFFLSDGGGRLYTGYSTLVVVKSNERIPKYSNKQQNHSRTISYFNLIWTTSYEH